MFQHQGIWLPDGEKHFPQWMDSAGEIVDGRGTYQIKKLRSCLPWIRNWRAAVDVGAHVGFWSIQMAHRFRHVYAFEPMAPFRLCFERNVVTRLDLPGMMGKTALQPLENVTLYPNPLGVSDRDVAMIYDPEDSGNTHVGGPGDMKMLALDSFEFQNVDFIKIDCEGYEHHVIEGARETITRCKPCIIVEQKQHKMALNYPGLAGTPAVDLLLEMGAKQRALISGDHILSFD